MSCPPPAFSDFFSSYFPSVLWLLFRLITKGKFCFFYLLGSPSFSPEEIFPSRNQVRKAVFVMMIDSGLSSRSAIQEIWRCVRTLDRRIGSGARKKAGKSNHRNFKPSFFLIFLYFVVVDLHWWSENRLILLFTTILTKIYFLYRLPSSIPPRTLVLLQAIHSRMWKATSLPSCGVPLLLYPSTIFPVLLLWVYQCFLHPLRDAFSVWIFLPPPTGNRFRNSFCYSIW